jgi:hypothetical protein
MASRIAIVTYYLYSIVEQFPVQVIQRHHTAPPPPTGDWWRKRGGFVYKKKGFLQSSNYFILWKK